MRNRGLPALVGSWVTVVLLALGTAAPGTAAATTGRSARASADGLTVTVSVAPSRATTAGPVRFSVRAGSPHSPGALAYDVSYGDGTTGADVTPQICLGGAGPARSTRWRLRHRYPRPGTYHVVVTVRALCTTDRATAHLTVAVAGG